ncbi:unnamed protein product [Cochlearia groenlandica]
MSDEKANNSFPENCRSGASPGDASVLSLPPPPPPLSPEPPDPLISPSLRNFPPLLASVSAKCGPSLSAIAPSSSSHSQILISSQTPTTTAIEGGPTLPEHHSATADSLPQNTKISNPYISSSSAQSSAPLNPGLLPTSPLSF